jgi:hypothetical protein
VNSDFSANSAMFLGLMMTLLGIADQDMFWIHYLYRNG